MNNYKLRHTCWSRYVNIITANNLIFYPGITEAPTDYGPLLIDKFYKDLEICQL